MMEAKGEKGKRRIRGRARGRGGGGGGGDIVVMLRRFVVGVGDRRQVRLNERPCDRRSRSTSRSLPGSQPVSQLANWSVMAAAVDNLMDFNPPSGPSTVRSLSGNGDRRSRGRPAGLQINTGLPGGEQKIVAESPASQQRPMTHLQLRRLLQDLSKGADQLLNDSEDKLVIRYAFYFLSRILGESDTSVGGAAGRNWDAVSSLDGQGGIAPREAISAVLNCLLLEVSSNDPSAQGRRAAALKAFVCMNPSDVDAYTKLYTIVESIFEKVSKKKRSRIGCHDPVGARHALAKLAALANKNPLLVANSLSKLAFLSAGATGPMQESPGVLFEAMNIPDTFAKVYLSRLLATMLYSREVKQRRGLWQQFANLLYQLTWDEHEKVALEAILGIIGGAGGDGSMELRAAGWDLLCAAEVVVPETAMSKEGPSKGKVPTGKMGKRTIFKVACTRLDFALCSSSRPSLHAAARVVGEIGKARAAAALMSEKTRAQKQYREQAKSMGDGPSSVLDGPTLSSRAIGGGDLECEQ
ncbi:hypothetical protein CBR_g10827 [Chara braunii]|uniref:Uncharacterized protein n=1 Tax=Chara braunii TaxID=69332 RepID=A0A388KPB2_CHABU|nr:hypothetical protein CBR_g10827 [Chara braunii]|eukprot:GBG71891.1 hypothetical protein CBR_g10827 [Chara braunii]